MQLTKFSVCFFPCDHVQEIASVCCVQFVPDWYLCCVGLTPRSRLPSMDMWSAVVGMVKHPCKPLPTTAAVRVMALLCFTLGSPCND